MVIGQQNANRLIAHRYAAAGIRPGGETRPELCQAFGYGVFRPDFRRNHETLHIPGRIPTHITIGGCAARWGEVGPNIRPSPPRRCRETGKGASGYGCPTRLPPPLAFRLSLQVGFDKPQPLVDAARDL